jgi:hypothetical protein
MRIDWQAYEDGLIESEQKLAADRALADDPAASRELEGLRALRCAVREAALAEPVPRERLSRVLRDVVGRRRVGRGRFVWLAAAVLACSIVLAVGGNLLWDRLNGESEASTRVDTAREAQEWAREQSDLSLPAIDLGPLGTIESAHAHTGWACYDYNVGGETIHVSMTSGDCSTTVQDKVETKYGTLYDDKIGGVVRFSYNNLYYMVRGASEQTRVEVSKRVITEAATKNRPGKRPAKAQ